MNALSYYEQSAPQFFAATAQIDMTNLHGRFLDLIDKRPARILDAGCGSGRDAKAFAALGHEVEAFDASPALVALAREHTALPVRTLRFQEMDYEERFDGLWTCASLLHVAPSEMPEVFSRCVRALAPGGVWYISFKLGRGVRFDDDRVFTDMDEAGLETLLAPYPEIETIDIWTSRDPRRDRPQTWFNVFLGKSR